MSGKISLKLRLIFLAIWAVLFSLSSVIQAESLEDKVVRKLKDINVNIELDKLEKSPMSGMYEITLKSGDIIFSDKNVEYLVLGQMYHLSSDKGFVNLSQQKHEKKVSAQLASYASDKQIVYAAKGEEKSSITVFTDITCHFCRKLHKAIPDLQKSGVTVKYMAFPREGDRSKTAEQMGSIWCAKDQIKAMNDAKLYRKTSNLKCANPVSEQLAIGVQLGVNATPTIFTDSGVKIAGFASTESLLSDLGIK